MLAFPAFAFRVFTWESGLGFTFSTFTFTWKTGLFVGFAFRIFAIQGKAGNVTNRFTRVFTAFPPSELRERGANGVKGFHEQIHEEQRGGRYEQGSRD